MQIVQIADITSLIIFILFDLFVIYFIIASRFLKYPPLIFSIGKTKKGIIRKVLKRIKKCETKDFTVPFTIVDAGCGIGTIIIPLAKEMPEHNFVGVEWSTIPYLISKFRARKIKNLTIVKKDMFKYDFKDVNIVICFLIGHLMKRFGEKCVSELKKKSYIFSSRFKFNNNKLKLLETMDIEDNFNYIHIYKYLPKASMAA